MASLVLSGDTSGSITVSAPAVSGSNTQTLAAVTGTLAPVVSGTAVTASGTSVDFTGIPSWVKRITVMFAGVSTNGTSNLLIQLGDAGGIENTGYVSSGGLYNNSSGTSITTSTAGFIIQGGLAAGIRSGHMIITNITGNQWVSSHSVKLDTTNVMTGGGDKTLSDVLTQVRVTTVNGTDTFDAGTINILYE